MRGYQVPCVLEDPGALHRQPTQPSVRRDGGQGIAGGLAASLRDIGPQTVPTVERKGGRRPGRLGVKAEPGLGRAGILWRVGRPPKVAVLSPLGPGAVGMCQV
jgi:hypothetical protein